MSAISASEQHEAGGAADADVDTVWQAAGNGYHRDLVELLRRPRMYKALGLSGPPHRIEHASLADIVGSMQLIHELFSTLYICVQRQTADSVMPYLGRCHCMANLAPTTYA